MATNPQVAERWAQRSTPEGRLLKSLSSRHLYGHDDRIISYSTCFACWHTAINGERIVLISAERYSNSTAVCIGLTLKALPEIVPVFTVQNVKAYTPEAHAENLANYDKRREDAIEKAAKARTAGPAYERQAEELLLERLRYQSAFGL